MCSQFSVFFASKQKAYREHLLHDTTAGGAHKPQGIYKHTAIFEVQRNTRMLLIVRIIYNHDSHNAVR